MLFNSRGLQDYCNGGDFTAAINYFVEMQFETFETESNYKYDFKFYEDRFYSDQIALLPVLLPEEDFIVPYVLVDNVLNESSLD